MRLLATLISLTLAAAAPAAAHEITVDAALDHGVLHADKKQTAYLRVGLTGFDGPGEQARARMNVAIVIDKSSSMSGDKIVHAKAGARAALGELHDDDIVSVVAYDDTVSVLVPATKVSDRRTILNGIEKLRAGGMTALFAGTSKGAAEVRKFLERERVNRVILLSDGQANVGPSSPGDLGRLGQALRREGVAVTTIGLGLGYNEDLMVSLAKRSGGKHVFVEHPRQLARLFRDGFGSLASIVAKEVVVTITLADGVRPVRALGADADIIGQTVTTQLAQLYAGETDEILLEVETRPFAASQSSAPLATVEVSYHDLAEGKAVRMESGVAARFSDRRGEVEASANRVVMVLVAERLANEKNRTAVRLRDEGKLAEARQVLSDNAQYLQQNAAKWGSDSLNELSRLNKEDAKNLDGERWNRQRKKMSERQHDIDFKGGDF